MYDLLIQHARVVDGTGQEAYLADVGVAGGRIVAIGSDLEGDARQVIDAKGWVLAPGFVDAHTHDDLALLRHSTLPPKVRQGITTSVIGNCGFGLAPVVPEHVEAVKAYAAPILGVDEQAWSWSSTRAFFETLQATPMGQHVCALLPHGPLRAAVMDFEARPASEQEIMAQEALVEEAMQAGATGMSLGLAYVPGAYIPTAELVRSARVVGRYGGVVAVHMRGEGDTCVASIQEMLTIAEQAEVAVHISHLKLTGRKNWGNMQQVVDLIADARARGLDITVDAYPYAAGSTTITQVLPQWVQEGGIVRMLERLQDSEMRQRVSRDIEQGIAGWENPIGSNGWDRMVISTVQHARNKQFEGKNLVEVSELLHMSLEDALFHILLDEQGKISTLMFTMDERDVEQAIQAPFSMIGSDGLPILSGRPHPRLYGTFPRFIRQYVRERKSIGLEQAVAKVTSFPAKRFRLGERGLIAEGKIADLVIFDPETISDRATYSDPQEYPDGIAAVIVAGQPVVLEGQQVSNLPGGLIVCKQ